ncbi:MAG: hypothetical protein K8T20_02730 [Planctomycetes bacterium]|nr:hypothetical protein [Planctomycetota bacterium]
MRLALFFALAASLSAFADSRVERTATWEAESPGARPERTNRRETLWIADGRVRSDDRVSRESWIVRTDKKVIWRLDHALKTFTEVTFEEAAKARADAADDLKAALARVAGSEDEPELRRFLDAFTPPDAPCECRDDGDGGPVLGKATRAVSVSPKSGPGVKGRVAPEGSGLDRLAKTLGEAGMLAPRVAEALAKSKGMMLSGEWTLVFPEAAVRETFAVTKIEEATAPEGTWDIPAGYRKVAAKTLCRNPLARSAPPGGYEGDRPKEEGEPVEEPTGEEAGKDE